jgi:predicted phage tail protein
MSIATFTEFANKIELTSPGFIELASNVSSPPALAAYAQKQGIELTTEEAAEMIESAKRKLEESGIAPLSADSLEMVNGGMSFLAGFAIAGAAIGVVASAVLFAPVVVPFLLGTGVLGTTGAFVAGTTGVLATAGAGMGAIVGGAVDLIKGD